MLLNGFSYNQGTDSHYYCIQRNKSCKARVKIDPLKNMIVCAFEEHTHPPPKYHVTDKGEYIRC